MIILAGTVRLPPENVGRALLHMQAMVKATRAEPGCIAYSFAWDIVDDGLVDIFEIYTDASALAAHRASAHMAAWRAVLPDLGVKDRNLTQYEISKSEKI